MAKAYVPNDSFGPKLSSVKDCVRGGCHAESMRHTSAEVDRAVLDVLRRQGYLVTRSQLLGAGWSEGTLRYRTRADGPWGVVLHFAPSRIRSDSSRVIAELRSAIESGLRRPPLAIRRVPQAQRPLA